MNEVEYMESVDACFPYDDEKTWRTTIDQGIAISDNAAYMALHAICMGSPTVPRLDLEKMLEYWSSKYDHPTKTIVVNAARAVMRGVELPEEEILRYLDEIARYPGLYNAIGIVWQAAPRDGNSVGNATERVEHKCEEIYRKWMEITGQSNGEAAFEERGI